MSTPNKRRAPEQLKEPTGHECARLLVLVASSLPLTAAGLEALLRAQLDVEVIVSSSDGMQLESFVRDTDPDVLILDVDGDEFENGQSLDFVSRIAAEITIIALTNGPSSLWFALPLL